MMFVHSALIFSVLYVTMRYGLKQGVAQAEARSMLIAALALAYMVAWGHGLPQAPWINPDLL